MIIHKEFRYPTDTSEKKRWYVTLICDKCGDTVTKTFGSGRNYDMCEACLKGRFTNKEFIERCNILHENKYDYTDTHYSGKRKQITYRCQIHGVITQRAQEHMEGHGCPQCARELRAESYRIPVDLWESRLKEKAPHVTLIDYEYLGYHAKATFKCDRHGVFTSTLGAINGTDFVCSRCANADSSRHSRHAAEDRTAYLYYVYIPSVKAWKIGVTSRSVQERFISLHANIIWQVTIPTEKLAYKIERVLLDATKEYRVFPKNTIKSGSSELLSVNIYEEIPVEIIQEITRASAEQSVVETHLNGGTLSESIPC